MIATKTNVARMNEILDAEVQEGEKVLSNIGSDITFDHVGFSYNNEENYFKTMLHLTAKQGEVTALVGPSGGGKNQQYHVLRQDFGMRAAGGLR
mgnify:CR=1 FL=1